MSNEMDLPPEYMAEIDAANKRRLIAQLLQKQALSYQGAPAGGKIAARTSPLAWMANIGTGMLGAQADASGAAQMRDVQNRALADQQKEVAGVLGLPEDQQFNAAMQGRHKQTQALGKLLQEQRQARLKGFADSVKDAAPEAAGQAYIDNKLPDKPNIPAPRASEFGTDPLGNPYARDYNRKGEATTKYRSPGVSINNIPAQVEKAGLIAGAGQLPKIGEGTMASMASGVDLRDKADRILALAKDPEVITGFAAEPQLFVQRLAAKLNLTGPESVAKTQSLLSGIAEQTLDASLDLKGAITEKEWPRLAQARAGEISYTPQALQELAYIARAKAHNQYIRALKQRQAAGDFEGGRQVLSLYPAASYGSAEFPKELYSERQDGTMQYTGSIDAILGKSPASSKNTPVLTIDQLSPAQKQQLRQLLGK